MKMAKDIAEATFGRMMSNGGSCYVSGMATFDKKEIESIIAAKLEPVREALAAIAGPCERLTSHRCIDEPDRYTVGAYYGDDRVCDACVADRTLSLFEGS